MPKRYKFKQPRSQDENRPSRGGQSGNGRRHWGRTTPGPARTNIFWVDIDNIVLRVRGEADDSLIDHPMPRLLSGLSLTESQHKLVGATSVCTGLRPPGKSSLLGPARLATVL